ncbi:MAG: glutamine-hydrolyzing carbamoyl-phosphate synthase small subunit [Actinobacteria bacterium]|jgi:carbamoyl-phosphate synthase small subunit|uniref:carbamoyl-phosphate synthase (glutamine-hydrolyzing) n=1 Tax=freshwater metagenome TaxID=449393 RepID=A0A6J6F6G6_9ZZZZ|nr:glutamine-hydrolyzing carbamoyl-phosphate synthase small subunit [Actinomycetota bacterium]
MINFEPAALVLEDGRIFAGNSWGAIGKTFGELVFATPMSGYQETITDPSYCGQILVQTAPHIGNTGMNDDDPESDQIWISGYVVRDPSRIASNWRSQRTLDDELKTQQIVGIANVDTRAITRHLRDKGAMRAGIFSGNALQSKSEMLAAVTQQPNMKGRNLTAEVTTADRYVVPAEGEAEFKVAAIDLGIKRNTPRLLSSRKIETHVFPANTPIDEILSEGFDGVFLSNGPGDPATATEVVESIKKILAAGVPLFGICFGQQLFGRALGLETYKLQFGHRGINQPVQDLATGKVAITAHNHGFAVAVPNSSYFETPFGPGRVTHRCLNDDVVEGIELVNLPAFSVQYHPEAAAGPHDAEYLFDKFKQLLVKSKNA